MVIMIGALCADIKVKAGIAFCKREKRVWNVNLVGFTLLCLPPIVGARSWCEDSRTVKLNLEFGIWNCEK
jgi:hypothetical protein